MGGYPAVRRRAAGSTAKMDGLPRDYGAVGWDPCLRAEACRSTRGFLVAECRLPVDSTCRPACAGRISPRCIVILVLRYDEPERVCTPCTTTEDPTPTMNAHTIIGIALVAENSAAPVSRNMEATKM